MIRRLIFASAGVHLVILPNWLAPVPGQGSAPLDPALGSQMYGIRCLLNNHNAQTPELNPASDTGPHVATLT